MTQMSNKPAGAAGAAAPAAGATAGGVGAAAAAVTAAATAAAATPKQTAPAGGSMSSTTKPPADDAAASSGSAAVVKDDSATDVDISKIIAGFKINGMTIVEVGTGRVLFEGKDIWQNAFKEELRVDVPKEILQCKAITRELDFSSVHRIRHFRLVQEVFLRGIRLEEWAFDFGKVIPNSRNTWSCTIEAAPPDQMLPAALLSGNVTIETSFYDGQMLVSKSTLRVFYV